MLKIYDGRNEFYQWDLDQKLIVFNPEVKEVHFCNQTSNESLVCEVYSEGGIRVVNVPNILLQESLPLRAYPHCTCATKDAVVFKVVARSRPTDYVYTETEVKTWEALEARITELEKGGGLDIDLEGYVKNEELEAKGYVTGTELEDKGFAKSTDVANEKTRAENAESALDTKITTETSRASVAEATIQQNLTTHIGAYTAKIAELETKDQTLAEAIAQHKREVDALLACDDGDLNELQEIVNYIKSNKSLIDAITTSKVSVADIVDVLTSEATNKPLSANQGRVLKGLIDELTLVLEAHKTAYNAKVAELANADTTNANAISAEVTRAKGAEEALSGQITAEANRAKGAEQVNATAITNEEARAKAAEEANATAISAEATRAKGVEAELNGKVTALQNAGHITADDIPTNVSAFNNDAGYCSQADLDALLTDGSVGLKYGLYTSYAELSGIGNCTDTEVKIGSAVKGLTVTKIATRALSSCKTLTDISIPDSVTSMGMAVFEGCANLTSAVIPDSAVVQSPNYFFNGCEKLKNVILGDGVTNIGQSMFNRCYALEHVIFGKNITSIGESAFYLCQALRSIIIPQSVTSIGARAFEYCSQLTDIYYEGTEAQWDAIAINSNNSVLFNATIHYNWRG